MIGTSLTRAAAMLTGIGFSLLYAALYPILIGGFVIYRYPYWPRPFAMGYVLGGILLQAWLCFRPGRPSGARLLVQVGAGFLYLAALAILPGSTYMSCLFIPGLPQGSAQATAGRRRDCGQAVASARKLHAHSYQLTALSGQRDPLLDPPES